MDKINKVLIAAVLCLKLVSAEIIECGERLCRGENPYCCELDDGSIGCCWDSFVYQNWWFWVIWVVIFFLVMACSLSCWRRRRARYRYVVMNNSQYPAYGTVVHAAPPAYPTSSQGHVAGATVAQASAPVKPPGYAEATSKPPPYSA